MTDHPSLTLADIEAIRARASAGRLMQPPYDVIALCDLAEAHLRQTAEPVAWEYRDPSSPRWFPVQAGGHHTVMSSCQQMRDAGMLIRPLYATPPPPTNALAATPDRRRAGMLEALESARGCFEAAEVEGLNERLGDEYSEAVRIAEDDRARSLWGLVERRLIPARSFIDAALRAAADAAPGDTEQEGTR